MQKEDESTHKIQKKIVKTDKDSKIPNLSELENGLQTKNKLDLSEYSLEETLKSFLNLNLDQKAIKIKPQHLSIIFSKEKNTNQIDSFNRLLDEFLTKFTELKELKLGLFNSNISIHNLSLSSLLKLDKLKYLTLNFGLNEISEKSMDEIINFFNNQTGLSKFSINIDQSPNANYFFKELSKSKNLEKLASLKISANNLNENFFFKPINEIIKNTNNLTTLSLNLSLNRDFKDFNEFCDSLLNYRTTLQNLRLILYGCNLNREEIENLCENLIKLEQLVSFQVDLRKNAVENDQKSDIQTVIAIEGMISYIRYLLRERSKYTISY